MIRFTNYSKQYNGELIIKADAGLGDKLYWLKGENGSGKTTLIKSIAGLIPFSGEITVGGINIGKDRVGYRKAVNYAEAEPVFPTFLSGADLIAFYAQTKEANQQQIDALVEALGIGEYMGNKLATYSSGMLKKLSLVLAFIGNPQLILLDEPLITLDQVSVLKLIDLIESYIGRGVVFIITSHQEIILHQYTSSRLSILNHTLLVD